MVFEPGQKIGVYKIIRRLGQGGMGAVYLAQAPDGELYAIKVMTSKVEDDGSHTCERFLREGEFARNIRHPNLIAVYEVQVDPSTGLNYIVMEYAPGGSIRDRLSKEGRFDIAEAVEIIRQVAYGLAAAHQHGVVHRDIKPDNILFAADGTPKLADLGVAKFTDGPKKMTMTLAEEVVGTPAYMAPEQMMDAHKVDSRADIYALGVVFYEMLAGERPNESDTYLQLLAKAVKGIPLPSVRKMRPEVSAALVQILNVMCAIRADDRFDSSQKLIDVLERLKREGLDTHLRLRQPPNRHRRRLLALSFLLGLSFLAIGAVAYDRLATFVEHYGDWVDEWGIPSGRIPLDEKIAEKRDHFTFEYRGRSSFFGKRVLRRVTQRDIFGFFKCTKDMMNGRRPEIMDIAYGEDGRLAYIDHVKPSGRIELRCLYSGADRRYIDFKVPERDGGLIAAFLSDSYDDEDDFGNGERNDTARIRRNVVTRDKYGRIVKVEFMMNDSNEPTADSDGFFGRVFERDEMGRVSSMYHIDEHGKMAVGECGVAFVRQAYNTDGNLREIAWYDTSTNAVLSANGYASQLFDYDDFGRCISETYRGIDGKPCLSPSDGYAGSKTTFDAENRIMRTMYLGLDGKPKYVNNGFGAGEEATVDLANHTPCHVRTILLDEDGEPRSCREGYAIIERFFVKGMEVERKYFDVDGRPAVGTYEFHRRQKIYDSFGNLSEIRFYGTDGKLCSHSDGMAIITHRHDSAGRMVERRFRDKHEKPCKIKFGYAVERLRYDSSGNLVELIYLDEANNPCETSHGYASVRQKFNAEGRLVRWECLSKDGRPPTNRIPVEEYSREKHGRITEIRHCDASGALCANKSGVARITCAYDGRGRRVKVDSYAPDGSRMGVAIHSEYDSRGCETLREYIGTNGCLTTDSVWGCKRMRMRYDDFNNCIERSFYDEHEKPMLNHHTSQKPFGIFRITYAVNRQTGMTEKRYYGVDGKPCLCARGYGGLRDFMDSEIERQAYIEFLGLGGTRKNLPKEAWGGGGFFGFEQRFNSRGDIVWKMHFDEDYQYVMRHDECGFLEVHDVTGRKIARLHLGMDGKPHKTTRGEWGWYLPADADLNGNKQKRQPIKDEGQAQKLFAQGMAAIVAPRNRFVEEWKKVRLEKVPKQL